ncbi:MAG: DUF1972 domain-containing protein [Specibacter sp.]
MGRSSGKAPALRIALVGTRGIPACYGGFETCVEEVGQRLVSRGHHVVVYCRGGKPEGQASQDYLGMKLVHLPAPRKRSLETFVHTGLSVAHLVAHRVDAAIVFNAANAPWLPILRAARIPVATHVDGLEWQRAKWGRSGKKYYHWAEGLSVRLSDALIADAVGIQEYYASKHQAESHLMAYGAPILGTMATDKIEELGLTSGEFHLVVSRFEPENNVDLMVKGYVASNARHPLVVVGSAPYSAAYTRQVRDSADSRVRFLGGIWDQELLNQLYAHSLVYWHGHSVGGTNPSLLRAMGAAAATNAFDVVFNREVLGGAGAYFATAAEIPALIDTAENFPDRISRRSQASVERAREYSWDDVAESYETLCLKLASGDLRGSDRGRLHERREPTPSRMGSTEAGA